VLALTDRQTVLTLAKDGDMPLVNATDKNRFASLPLAVSFIIAIFAIVALGFLHERGSEQRYPAGHHHAQYVKDGAVKRCSGRHGLDFLECVQKDIEASEETARSEQALIAQQQAAWAGMASALWAGIGLCITIIGTILLYQQIVLTRTALEGTGKATDAMVRQNELTVSIQRPWLSFEIKQAAPAASLPGESAKFEYDLLVKNSGVVPATETCVHVGLVRVKDRAERDDAPEIDLNAFSSEATTYAHWQGFSVAPQSSQRIQESRGIDLNMAGRNGFNSDPAMPLHWIGLKYRCPTTLEWHISVTTFLIMSHHPNSPESLAPAKTTFKEYRTYLT
jgi:hypothetical protein